jgi:GTP-binding protein Era
MAETPFRFGFAALVGRPNVGKSTLLNALIAHPVSIVSPKPQTTRHRILGILTRGEWQVAFIDMPGVRTGNERAIDRYMERTAAQCIAEADVQLFVVVALHWTRADGLVRERLRESRAPIIVVVNQIDRVAARSQLIPFLERLQEKLPEVAAIVPVSARTRENLDRLESLVASHLPAGPAHYPAEQVTDRSERFRAGEVIREQLTVALSQELPYGITVEIEQYVEDENGFEISALIVVERKGQKPIVLGKGGERLKGVGRAARLALKEELGRPVHLNLWVKVQENWADSERALRALGYESS